MNVSPDNLTDSNLPYQAYSSNFDQKLRSDSLPNLSPQLEETKNIHS
jgi:hypothetical protein